LKTKGTALGMTLSGFAHHTTLGNGNTCMAIDHYVTKGIDSASFAAGDDNVIVSDSKDSKIIEKRYRSIMNTENGPKAKSTGIILKEMNKTKDSVSFCSKNYTYQGGLTPQ